VIGVTCQIDPMETTLHSAPWRSRWPEKALVEQPYISLVETGKQEPCLRNIELLAGGLGVSLRTIFWDL